MILRSYLVKPLLAIAGAIFVAIIMIVAARFLVLSNQYVRLGIKEISVDEVMLKKGGAVSYLRSTGYKQKRMFWAAPIDYVLATPEWVTFPYNPPLSLEEAVAISKRWQHAKGINAPFVSHVSLYQKPPGSKRWAYTINFDPNTDTRMTSGDAASSVVVLLDGTVVKRTVQK